MRYNRHRTTTGLSELDMSKRSMNWDATTDLALLRSYRMGVFVPDIAKEVYSNLTMLLSSGEGRL